MTKFWIYVALIIFVRTLFAADIDPALQAKLQDSSMEELIPVSLQVDRPGLKEALAPCRSLPMPERRESATAVLREYSSSAQQPVLNFLETFTASGDAEKIRSSYLGGTISFFARPYLIREVSARQDVLRIIDNSPKKVFQYNPPREIFSRPMAPMGVTWSVDNVNANDAWATGFYGDGVVVGILDSGVRYTHVDLAPNMWQNEAETANGMDDDFNGYIDDIYGYDFVNDDGDPWDDHGHGTSCAGLVAGNGTAISDTTGTAPGAKVMALKVINSSGSGIPSDAVSGLQYGLDNGAHLFSVSLGWSNPNDELKDWFRANLEDVYDVGVVVVTSAGNDGEDYARPQSISAPADCPSPSQTGASSNTAIISVGSINQLNLIMGYSSRGPTHWDTDDYSDFPWPPGLMKPELCAPGYQITTTRYTGDTQMTYSFGGTSAAAPCVAGGVALMLSKNPALTPEDIDTLLRNTCYDLGPAGHDTAFGAGRLDCYALITAVPTPAFPIIRVQSHETDDSPPTGDGSGVFDAGEQVNLIVEVKNVGAASNVTGTISIMGDPYISVIDGSTNWGSLSTGVSADNNSDPFVIYADGLTPPGYTTGIQITMFAASETYVDTIEVSVGQYPREIANHNTPTLSTTISNFGSFGYFNPNVSTPTGNGFEYNSTQTLYGGGFFLRVDYDDVITWENGFSSEFIPLMETVHGGCPAGDCHYTAYIDPNSMVKVAQQSFTFNSSSNQDFILYRIHVSNYSDSPMTGLCIGFYTDFDLHYDSEWFDRAQWVSASNWGYMWDSGASPLFSGYVGLVNLEGVGFGSVVENPIYVYPSGMGWEDTVKSNFLTGVFSESDGSSEEDWSLIVSSGTFSLAPMEMFVWGVAVVAGDNLTDWQTNAGQAIAEYSALDIYESVLPENIGLQVSPNPFNSGCVIHAPGNETALIYDLQGRLVFHIELNKGIARWDGSDDSGSGVSSGIYLVKTGETGETAKIILLK